MEYFVLNNGMKLPAIGSGTNTFGRDNSDLKSQPTGNFSALVSTIEAGYRFFDCALSYGNEEGLGKVFNSCEVPREELIILNKIPNRAPYNVDEESIRNTFNQSLETMGMDYFDIYMIHQAVDYNSPDGKMNKELTIGIYKVLEKLYEEGKVKAIGVANFNEEQLSILMSETKIVPACNQIRSNPALRNYSDIEFMKKHGIRPMAHSAMNFTKAAFKVDEEAKAAYIEKTGKIASKYGKTWGQVLLRQNYQLGLVSIPKSHTPEYQKNNINIFDFELTDDEMEILR